MLNKMLATTVITLALAGCGGSSGSSTGSAAGTPTGYFKDSNTAGLSYVSGGKSGVTGANGSFTYEAGKPVTFSIGGVTLGTISSGKSIGTPVDLVTAGSSNATNVKNIARFLMMLDNDANPVNGLNISSAVQAIAKNWAQLDFSSPTFDTDAAPIITSVNTADGRSAALPSAVTAKAHLEATLRCAYSGAYKGTYTGSTDHGNFGVMIDTQFGNVTGVAYSVPFSSYITVSGANSFSYDQTASFVTGNTGAGATFTGQFTSVDGVSGTWAGNGNGSFSGSRIGGALNATYRLTGQFSGSDYGLFAVDIDSANKVTGVGYSVTDGTLFNLSGSLTPPVGTATTATLNVSATTGASITGALDVSTDQITGTWGNAGASGTFNGSGCQLN